MMGNNFKLRSASILFVLSSIFLLANFVSAATYDASGEWNLSISNGWTDGGDNCPLEEDETVSVTITQDGDSFTLVVGDGTLSGSITDNNYNITTYWSEDEENEVTVSGTFTLSSSTSGTGQIDISVTEGTNTCYKGMNIILIKQSDTNAAFDYGVVISENRHYEPPFTTSDLYFMLIAAEVDTNSYPVYVHIPGASVDTSLTYAPGWDDLTPFVYARGFGSPSPGGDWEGKTYTFYIDMIQNGQKDHGEPTTTWYIPQGSISQMALVQNVSISAGYNPTITWDPAPNADTYRIRFVPIKNGNPDTIIGLFQSDEFSGSSSYSFTYTGNLFKDYGPLAILIEAWKDYNDLTLNRSRYIVKHDPCKKIMPSIPLLLLDD